MGDVTVEDANGVVRVLLGNIGTDQDPDYGLIVTSSDGSTVIIDGTSDMFRIDATGTLSTSGAGTGTAHASVDLTTGLLDIPTCLIFEEFTDSLFGFNAGEPASALVLTAAGLVSFLYEGWAEITAVTGVTKVVVQTSATTAGAGGRGGAYRYYVLEQVAF